MENDLLKKWLEEGLAQIGNDAIKDLPKSKPLPPSHVFKDNDVPKPLFVKFFDTIDFSSLLHQYLSAAESLLSEKDKQFDKYEIFTKKEEKQKEEENSNLSYEKVKIIDFERKNIYLSETETFTFFERPDSAVFTGQDEYEDVIQRNLMYQQAVKRRKDFPELFQSKLIQTSNPLLNDQETEAIPDVREEKYAMVNDYLMKEHFYEKEITNGTPLLTFQEFIDNTTKFYNYDDFLECQDKYFELLSHFNRSLYVTEKTLDYNTCKQSILSYSDYKLNSEDSFTSNTITEDENKITNKNDNPEEPDDSKENTPNVTFHLSFFLEKMKDNYRVSFIEFNPANPNIFISGYGVPCDLEIDHDPKGLILCWNIKKCGYPEKIFYTQEVVTCLQFSKRNPNLIAVGMRYGLIAIYDIQRTDNFPVTDNYTSQYRTNGSITSIKWMQKKYAPGKDTEVLLSISMDGIINWWNLGRELDGNVLRYIKRDIGSSQETEKRMVLAMNVAGLCMSIKPDDSKIYSFGTIEGQVFQADFNDPINYLHVYNCHNGPIYDLQWSPLVPDVFITCSIDYYIHFWKEYHEQPSKTLKILKREAILKLAWSNITSTLFAVITQSKLLIYDLAIDLYNPLIRLTPKRASCYTYVTFSTINNWFLAGTCNGTIEMYEIINISAPHKDQEAVLKAMFLHES